jgi:branched-chain amino acid aminotransferase
MAGMSQICLDGVLVPAEAAVIPVTDEGLLRGDGVFEVVRLYAGVPFALEEHLQRMRRSAENLRLELDIEAVAADVARVLAANQPGDAALRVLATRGGHRVAIVEALPDLPPTLSLGAITYSPTRVLDGVKSLSYAANMLCGRLARERGFDEALMVTPHGRVLEAPTSSFFWVRDGQLHTPPLQEHLLDSITRRAVMACAEVRETPTTLDDLRDAEEAFLASSMREVLPVHRIEDVSLAAPGPVTETVAERVGRHIADALAGAAR